MWSMRGMNCENGLMTLSIVEKIETRKFTQYLLIIIRTSSVYFYLSKIDIVHFLRNDK